jgi:peptidoglycan/xylan/chitin deacetylase (PgdA/CDA1 family)
VLRDLKLHALRFATTAGLSSLVLHSGWRGRRLPVLCYHGLSFEDEHQWLPALYMPQHVFRQRLEILGKLGVRVLPFGEAIEQLYAGDLPPKSVALTFDDGFVDFHRLALPLLREFGFPATVYLTTQYCEYNRPPFQPICSYLLWKSRGRTLDWPELTGGPLELDGAGQAQAAERIFRYAVEHALTAQQRNELANELAERVEVDYADLCGRRILHLMSPAEVRETANSGLVDIQLHTHTHRISSLREVFREEILTNQCRITAFSGANEHWHMCYPSGAYLPELPEWLAELGIESAVTCNPGLASRRSNRMLLPRILDGANLSNVEFEAWVTGVAACLPLRGGGGTKSGGAA